MTQDKKHSPIISNSVKRQTDRDLEEDSAPSSPKKSRLSRSDSGIIDGITKFV